MAKDERGVAKYINHFFSNSKNPVLFAGAGVSVYAGHPSWETLLEQLAIHLKEYDNSAASCMNDYIKDKFFCEAADIYKLSPKMINSEKYEVIERLLKGQVNSENLCPLVSLPFTSIVTTNYDDALHNAYSKAKSSFPKTVELSNDTLKRAPYIEEFFIARIHGQFDLPNLIVISTTDFKKLLSDKCYQDFLINTFTRKSCLFIGFSFSDPAISNILSIIKSNLGELHPKKHFALIPDSEHSRQLVSALRDINVDVMLFDCSNNYESLWEGIELSSSAIKETGFSPEINLRYPLTVINEFIATTYARIKLSSSVMPLRQIVIDGFILEIIKDDNKEISSIISELSELLHIPLNQIEDIVLTRLSELQIRGLCKDNNGVISSTSKVSNQIHKAINILVEGIQQRLVLREGIRGLKGINELLRKIIEQVLLFRGWDLGAYYAGAKQGEPPNIKETLKLVIQNTSSHLDGPLQNSIINAAYDLFQNADNTESEILSNLGRVTFAIHLVLQSPCETLIKSEVLPEILYFDSNYLMPAITIGHPYQELYTRVLNRLRDTANLSGAKIVFRIANSFINEIISHRKKAIREFHSYYLDKETLKKDVELYRPENVNVFLAGYWGILHKNPHMSLEQYLQKYAPYENERQLSQYLDSIGIESTPLIFEDEQNKELNRRIKLRMTQAYYSDPKKEKIDILIQHDAKQITQLAIDINNGKRSLFVTTDSSLRKIMKSLKLTSVENSMIHNRGIIQLVDLLLGVEGDPRVMTRLYWSNVAFDEESEIILRYFTNLGLNHRDEAIALGLRDTLEVIQENTLTEAKSKHISFNSTNERDRVQSIRFLEFMEDGFYKQMTNVVNKNFPDTFNQAESERIKALKNKIIRTQDLLHSLNERLRGEKDKESQKELRIYISQLKEYLFHYKTEQRNLI